MASPGILWPPPRVVEIPLERPRSKVYSPASAAIEEAVSPSLGTLFDAASKDMDVLPVAVTTAVAAVLHRYSGERSVGVGTASRLDRAAAALALAIEITPEATTTTLLSAVRAAIAAAEVRGSFQDLLAGLGLEPLGNCNPLFAIAVRVEGVHGRLPDVRNDLTLTLECASDGWRWRAEYRARVLTAERARRFVTHVTHMLERLLTQPDLAIVDVPYLGPNEIATLTRLSTGRFLDIPNAATVLDWFEDQAARHPNAAAVIWPGVTLTYADIQNRSNHIAAALVARGAGPGTRVGLCAAPSADLILVLIGIMQTGAAIVPFDPGFPRQRLAAVAQDAALSFVVVERVLRGLLDEVPTMDFENLVACSASPANAKTTTRPQLHDPAYILFTSGSTGRPKGVIMPHCSLANLVQWQIRQSAPAAPTRTLQRSSIAFDVAFQEIFATLCGGGTLIVATEAERSDVSLLIKLLAGTHADRVFLPPIVLRQIAEAAPDAGALRALREIIVAGEQLRVTRPIIRLFRQLEATLTNQYGPTETHVVTAYRLSGTSLRWPELPPIGHPIDNAYVCILDDQRRHVPIGVAGEIHIGGLPTSLGYFNRDDLTAEAYIEISSLASPTAHLLYRTGDIGRFREDGEIEFLGRRDDQIKLRGYRVELGEIDAALRALPGIREAAARAFEDASGDRWLAAYIVVEPGAPTVPKMRELLAERLPAHMVPAAPHFVSLDRLPLTPTGKLDRGALPRPDPAAWASARAVALADGELEAEIATVWSRTLDVKAVAIDDDFLDLGGHSLLAIRIVTELNERYAVSVPLGELLRGTTVRGLARLIQRLSDSSALEAVDQLPPESNLAGLLRTVELPNGKTLLCSNPAEALYMYVDVVEHRSYEHSLVECPSGGTVVDVGANIGLFTLLALERGAARVVAIEPAPLPYEALCANTRAAGPRVRAFQCAADALDSKAPLTYYPGLSGMTSLEPDHDQDRALLTTILTNLDRLGRPGRAALGQYVEAFIDQRLQGTVFLCEVRTLSGLLADAGVDVVDLLKVDVHRGERRVLSGLADDDWRRIQRVVIEMQDMGGSLGQIVAMLRARGMVVDVRQNPLHRGSTVHFVYGSRRPCWS